MRVIVATFNLNNLFSRFNFTADVDLADPSVVAVESRTAFNFEDPAGFKLRTYLGRLVKGKPAAERALLVERIRRIDADVLAVQEAEDIDTLRAFNRDDLAGAYRYVVLVEGNDPRLIDVGLLSKLPLGGVTSWLHVPDPAASTPPVFSRDLLEVEVLHADRTRKAFTVYNTHLKSHFVPFTEDPVTAAQAANELRARQAAAITKIVEARMRPDSRFVITGDMNDAPDTEWLSPMVQSGLGLVDGLAAAVESRPFDDDPPPPAASWTHRFKPRGAPAEYQLFDQVWLSPSLAGRLAGAGIDRRRRKGGDGSDHDPAWVALEL